MLSRPIMTTPHDPNAPELPAITLGYQPIVAHDPVPAIDHCFRQTAHRALSVAIWLLVGRTVLAFWPRTFDFAPMLLIAAFLCLDVTIAAAFMSLGVARHRQEPTREPKTLLLVALTLLIPTLLWIFQPHLAALLSH
jgi:hypothetical protein